ncbi:MAG: hypothetical protein BZY87_10605 [SAR202 cluster bacterium Io17-Chloro-G6]|nr:MAG: hypothetical protein BZY87_10605 [SAR202 cluster bacterium Io17-Chloro-G6]
MTTSSGAAKGDVLLLVGTRKGGFVLSSDKSRRTWVLAGPYCAGSEVFHSVYDSRSGRVLAANNQMVWGPEIQFSDDLGGSWSSGKDQPRFSDDTKRKVDRLWHIEPGRDSEPGVLYVGVQPAALFKSADDGDTWNEVAGLSAHPTRDQWQPGLGGLCLHSIVLDPRDRDRAWVGMSAVGVFGTADGGENWRPMNQGVRADFFPDPFPEFGHCPHKVLSPESRPDVLYQQNHCGVFRSDSAGETWIDITGDLPSRFGFVMGIHSQDPDTIYVLPEDEALGDQVGGGLRYVTDAKMRVFRSRNGGRDWEPMTKGLPQQNAYINVLREGMATDILDPCGIYLGTTTGQIFFSRDDGGSWELMLDTLPPILSLETGLVL